MERKDGLCATLGLSGSWSVPSSSIAPAFIRATGANPVTGIPANININVGMEGQRRR